MSFLYRSAILLLVTALSLMGESRATVIVRVEPAENTALPGGQFTVNLLADIPDPVVGWGLDLAFDPSTISRVGSPAIGPQWLAGYAPDGDGLTGLAFPGSVSGNGILLAALTFTAQAPGQTDLVPGMTTGDLTEGFPLDPTGFATVTFQNAHVTVIPEPTVILLLTMLLPATVTRIAKRHRRRL